MGVLYGKAAIYLANVILIASLLVFARGFFPHKAFLPGLATWPPNSDASARSAPFDRVVFMVVDALRSDFVYGNASNFTFTQSLVRAGAALPFTGHASPPTITMPRVKAITTGSVPSFVDLVLNFAESDTTSTLKDQDSWLAQLRAKGGNLVMYGDDTWIRLFPDFFHRADGTTSFFVSDFTGVDNNVTRHLPSELARDDWSAMTLHFLGLDHIGHKTGPKGPNMPAKQAEMDGIIKQIYTAMQDTEHMKSCLLAVLGDHGMNEGGNHGASSPGEVSTALTFISPKFHASFDGQTCPIHDAIDYKYYDEVEQSDIVPTLAALLGFPVPLNNLGVIIPRFLDLWTMQQDQYDLLYENAQQIHRIAQATFPNSFAETQVDCSTTAGDDADILACLWQQVSTTHATFSGTSLPSALNNVKSFLYKAQSLLSGTASNYDLTSMQLGIALATLALALCLPMFIQGVLKSGVDGIILVVMMLTYAVTMFASSYVEEEHQFWYWMQAAWLAILFCKDCRYVSAATLDGPTGTALVYLLQGVIRRWRQTGQKYAGDPDLLSDLVVPNAWVLWTLVVLTYAIPSRNLSRRAARWLGARQMGVLPVLVAMSAFLFKIAFTAADAPELLKAFPILSPLVAFVARYPLVSLARVVFLGLAHLLGCAIYYETPWKSVDHLHSFLGAFQDVLSLFLITQTRTVYVPLYLFFNMQLYLLRRGRKYSVGEVTILALLFQYASFFTFGGTNSIATIDLSNAYNGVSGYNVLAVGILTFASNWAGPIWWAFAVCQLFSSAHFRTGGYEFLLTALATFACVHTLAVMVACLVLREHLFIWTVFSPKYLYTAAWVVGQHTVVNMLGVASLLWSSRG
ncbi:major facilitator superfamily transporter protein [Elasticomyces elasticus]|uniref:GPI ethanolamine phosphate transferase 2 n=1 Tax=Exophiala sideris TaxID=1016849 RepID=A0ABR0JE68_9EURO|nr:major facilitator superfamily transporter protein [Elasticomyces elasticus]KAK5032695.1 major facilitator superfamily transporter protein [Exophiala sideris]KAK5037125.1 major facilitator superfamily transporter protein [Exophiala sideris]KAK5062219.1 major facilitator superfamily transporter protein [Exophiala sideris]KAK5182283.1 major facilitator superfamily transporter protein [Eurotiomycetes sp. CCFEE 6388]